MSASKRLDRAGEAAAVILSKRIIRLRLPGHRLVYVRSVVAPTGTANRIKWWLHGMTPEWEADQ